MENREQMMHVARSCFDYENMPSGAVKSCANCVNYEEGTCLKNVFDSTLITID